MSEFDLIRSLVDVLAEQSRGGDVELGPGDDCAVINVPPGQQLVSSIDALLPGVHYPVNAPAEYIGYRALGVCVSDLAAMGALPSYALVALSMCERDRTWLQAFAKGIKSAAALCKIRIAGGNMAQGPENISISVHGFVPTGASLLRSGAQVGDNVYVTGPLGGAALALSVALSKSSTVEGPQWNSPYYQVVPQITSGIKLRGVATSAIDISDGLVADVGHIAQASGVAIEITTDKVPVAVNANLSQALYGGDDYQLCFTSAVDSSSLPIQASHIGVVAKGSGVYLDGQKPDGEGYEHFRD